MKQKNTRLIRFFLAMLWSFAIGAVAVSAVAIFPAAKAAPGNNAEEKNGAQMSAKGLYSVSFKSMVIPIPLNRIHSWTIHIETANGKPVEDARIAVFGGMPLHKHSFPTAPRVTKNLGDGNYLIEGIKFSMSGHWEIWLNIHTNKTDKVKFDINL